MFVVGGLSYFFSQLMCSSLSRHHPSPVFLLHNVLYLHLYPFYHKQQLFSSSEMIVPCGAITNDSTTLHYSLVMKKKKNL